MNRRNSTDVGKDTELLENYVYGEYVHTEQVYQVYNVCRSSYKLEVDSTLCVLICMLGISQGLRYVAVRLHFFFLKKHRIIAKCQQKLVFKNVYFMKYILKSMQSVFENIQNICVLYINLKDLYKINLVFNFLLKKLLKCPYLFSSCINFNISGNFFLQKKAHILEDNVFNKTLQYLNLKCINSEIFP